jgi:hypothetical protein
MVAAGSLLALLLASGARAGEVSATQGPLDLGTRVNGVAGGRCQGGQCEVSGGTAAGANLFHRFNRFDTRGEIRGVSIQNGPYRTVVLGVLDPLGSFLNKGISLSSPAHLFFLSPGGLHVGAGAQFFNTPRLTLSTASSLGLGSGRFEVFRTTASEAALLTGVPIRGKGGLSSDPAEAQSNGISSGGDLVVDGGLIQVDAELLLDAQGGHLLLQAGSQLAVPGGSVELNGKNVTVAAGALVTTSAQAPAGPAPETTTAPGTTTAPAVAPVVPAPAAVATTAANSAAPALATAAANPSPTTIPAQTPAALVEAPAATATTATTATSAAPEPATPVLTAAAANPASATPQTSALQVPAAVAGPLPETNPPAPVQIPAGLDGGVIRISASKDALVAGQLKALGVVATASGTAASGQAGKGGRIEITGQRVALTGAVLDASGPAGGGTVLLGGDVRGANPAVANASSTTVDGASTVRADALVQGDGGTVVAYANQRTEVAGLLSVRGGPEGGNGGFVETSGATVALSRAPDLAAPLGKGGTWLIDPYDIEISNDVFTKTPQQVGLFNTGIKDDGTIISDGTLDPHWFLGTQGVLAYKTASAPFWTPNSSLSAWISDVSNNTGNNSSPGDKTFTTEFNLNAKPLAESSLTARIWVDDAVTGFSINSKPLNGVTIPYNGETDAYQLGLSPLDFKEGTNRISVTVNNIFLSGSSNGFNKSGLRVEFSGEFKFNDHNVSNSSTSASSAYVPTNTPSRLSVATIQSALNAGGSVIIDTTNPQGAQAGNITVNSPINKTAGGAASLTLNAHNNIVLNSNISSTSAALNLNLNADIDGNGSGATSLASGARLSLNDGTVTANGPISIAANSKIKDTKIIAPTLSSDGGILDNVLLGNQDLSQPLVFSGAAYIDNGLRLASGASVTSTGSWLLRGDGEQAFSVSQTPFAITNTSNVGGSFYLWPKDYSFKQVFKAQETGYPVELAVNGGNNQNPMSFRLVISASDEEIFVKDYTGLTQRSSDWATSFPISGLTRPIKAGETVELSLTPSQSLGVEPLLIDNANWPRYPLPGYGDIALRFYVKLAELPASVNLAGGRIISDSGSVGQVLALNNGVDLKLNNTSTLDLDGLKLNGGSLQANGTAKAKALDLIAGSISGSGDLQVTQGFNRSGGTIDGNFSNLSITQASGSLSPGALSAAGPVTLRAQNGQLNLNAPITASTVLARGSSGITLSGGASLTASAPSGRTITLDAGSGAFLNNYSAGAAALVKQPGATWAIYAANPTTTPPANLGGLPYNFKQYNQTFDTNQGSNPILGSGNGLFFANSPTLSVNLLPVSKVYDGEVKVNPSTLNYNVTGVLAGDEVTINKPATGVYDNKSAGTGKLISVSGLSVTSAKDTEALVPVYGYSLSSTEASAAIGTITPLDLPVTGLVALDKVYDATTVAPLQGSRAAVSPLSGDQVTVGGTAAGALGDKNVGIDKAVTVTGLTIAGKDAGNYNLLQQTGLVATISRKDLPVTGLVALDKVYDATTVAPLGGSAAVSPFSGDEVTLGGTAAGAFSDKNVGIDKAVTVTGVTIAGNDAGNYNLLPLTNLKAAITPATLQISASSDSKIYDGSTQSSLAPKITQGSLWGDDRLTGLAQTYESKNALGAGQSKLIVSAYTLSDGNNGGNYVLSFLPGLGTINRASVTPSFTVKSKQYDGNVAAEIAGDSLQGGLASDEVFMVGASALFDNASAGNDKLVTITGYTLSGQDADNYQLSSPTATSTASITTQQGNDSSLPNDEPIKNEQANPTVGLQLSTLSSATASKSVDVDISNIVLLPPGASALESTPAGSTQSQPTPSATAVSATSSVPNQTQPTASATAVTADSATQEYQESDNRSAEDAKTSLGLSNAPTSEAMSPARLQLVMQSAASFIRKYPARMPNQ